jgi:phage-related protein
MSGQKKPIIWVGDSKARLASFPEPVRSEIGFALYQAEHGERHPMMTTMSGLPTVEIVSDWEGDTFRGVFTTRFKGIIFVLHCFKKKSKKGAETPKPEIDLIRKRLKDAQEIYETLQKR